MEPIRLGRVPRGHGTPDRYATVESDDGPLLRIDLYKSSEECFVFEKICLWCGFTVIGWGHHVYLVEIEKRTVLDLELDNYFGSLYPREDCLLVASAERLFYVEPDGSLLWRSDPLGVDGVVVDQVAEGVIRGAGDWDPPGDWRPFQLSLNTGQRA